MEGKRYIYGWIKIICQKMGEDGDEERKKRNGKRKRGKKRNKYIF